MNLFFYGTLQHQPLFDLIAGRGDGATDAVAAVLPDHGVVRQDASELPVLLTRPGAAVAGVLWSGLTPAQRARLDLYEVSFGTRPAAGTVVLADGRGTDALIYRPPTGIAVTDEAWSLARWVLEAAPLALLAAQELAATDPWPDGPTLAWQWGMIGTRAAAVQRAGLGATPATLRHDPAPGDALWHHARPLQGRFFRLASLSLRHRRLDGTISDPLLREVLAGTDAAVVLPYDPVRDRVLLVEQVRPGPMLRGDRNPWTLEPIAGIVDPGETPEQAALRECAEEASLAPQTLIAMFSIYASPGSSTDHFFCYLGLADLPDGHAARGGLAEEGEDLRLHLVSFDAAMALIDSGEANAGPLVAMLLWLARHRDRLRQAESGLATA